MKAVKNFTEFSNPDDNNISYSEYVAKYLDNNNYSDNLTNDYNEYANKRHKELLELLNRELNKTPIKSNTEGRTGSPSNTNRMKSSENPGRMKSEYYPRISDTSRDNYIKKCESDGKKRSNYKTSPENKYHKDEDVDRYIKYKDIKMSGYKTSQGNKYLKDEYVKSEYIK